jgi:hypothetical protein
VGADDPIPTDVKVQTWHKLYPQYADNIGAVMQGGSLMQKVKHELINPMPGKPPKYDNIVIMVGEDRKDMPIAGALMKAVNKFPGYEHVKVGLETIPRTRPISFTKLRDVLKNPNATPEQQYAVWAQGFNAQQLGKDWILHLMDISRKGMGITAQPAAPQPAQQPAPVAEVRLFNSLVRPSLLESTSSALAHTAKSLENPPKVMQHRARRDMERDQQLKGRDIAKRNEEFNGEYDDEAGMAQSNLRTMARAVDGLLKTIKSNDNLPEWGQEKIAKAEMMLVSVWDYLQSQKELGMDPKVDMAEATSAAIRLQRAIERQRAKSDASLRRTPSSIPKPEPKKDQGVAEGLSKRDQQDVAAIRAAIARLEAQLNHPNADRDAIQQSIAHEKKRLALYGQDVAERMLPKSAFAGSDKNKLGPAAHAKGKQKGPVKKGQFVGGMEEGVGSKLAGLGLAGAMALGAGGAQARVSGDETPGINRLTGKPNTTQQAVDPAKAEAPKGFSKEYLQKAADPNRFGRYMISVEKAQELLNKMNAVDEAKKKGADGKACWKGYRYAGTKNGKDKCVPVGEDVENIMGALIENLIRK